MEARFPIVPLGTKIAASLPNSSEDLVENADSVTFCLSKGLAAPVGSVVCGGEKFIYQVRRNRKALGGGMRQAGILAAAGLLSLNLAESQLLEDHKNAKLLAEGIAQINGLTIDEKKVQTNIIYFGLNSPKLTGSQLVSKMEDLGIKFFETSSNRFRLVTHYGITRDDIEKTLEVLDKMVN
ncbi:hypothetical protein EB821_01530 [Candidatus Marinimicrobia bacterium PRS2]|nr:hypothetical protein EB821_01530 [Candidatus Marinimicrobia bacterium PRS2]